MALVAAVSGILAPFKEIKAASCVLQGNTITVSCDFAPGTYYYNGTFTVNSGVKVTAGSVTAPGQVVIIADDITINGTIDANGLGSGGNTGECRGSASTSGGGACHAGGGGTGNGGAVSGINYYGSATAPIDLGSGGGDDTSSGGIQSGAGGGAVKLATYSSTGTVTVASSGGINANGRDAVTIEAGGGSGGSIWIDAGILAGSGIITASGGKGSGSAALGGGGGGGGRIALHYFSSTANYTLSATGGAAGTVTTNTATRGGAGTIFQWDKDDPYGSLLVDAGNFPYVAVTRQTPGHDYTFSNVTIRNGAKYMIGATTTMEIASGGALTGGGALNLRPELQIFGTLVAPSEAMTVSAIDIHQSGTFAGVKYLNYEGGIYSVETSSALFSAGRGDRLEGLTLSATTGYTIFSASSTGIFYVDTMQVKSGAVVTHASNTTAAAGIQHALSISATTSIEVQSGGSIDVTRKGWNVTEGTGQGTDVSSQGAGGGAHGGDGGIGTGAAAGGTGYGSITQPATLGSGGGNDTSQTTDRGRGGGIIKLTAGSGSGLITIDGTLVADGGDTQQTVLDRDGGGAGGSIWIDVPDGTVAGSGTLQADGGDGYGQSATAGSGGGGGGRIAVYYSGSHSLTLMARGGSRGSVTTRGATNGGAGTIYQKAAADTNGTLTLDNDNLNLDSGLSRLISPTSLTLKALTIQDDAHFLIPLGATVTVESGGTVTGGGTDPNVPSLWVTGTFNAPSERLTLTELSVHHTGTVGVLKYLDYDGGTYSLDTSSALFSAGRGNRLETLTLSATSGGTYFSASSTAIFRIDALEVKSGATLTHAPNSTTALGLQHRLSVSATTTIAVRSGGAVDVSGRGYSGSYGTGPGADSGTHGAGGAYGGDGGRGTSTGGTGYGSYTQPDDIGSGGGNDTSATTYPGGSGGGSIKLTAASGAGTITIDGDLIADGLQPSTSAGHEDGGGAGGSIWLEMPSGTVAGTGTVRADGGRGGGTGSTGGGGGGGGRIAVYFSGTHSLTLQARGGRDGATTAVVNGSGGAGTIYESQTGASNPDLTVDNDDVQGDSAFTRVTTPTSATFKNLSIRDDAQFLIPTASSITVEATTGTISGSSGATNRPAVWVYGTLALPTESFTLADLDVHHFGTIGGVKYLTYDAGLYSLEAASALFSAGRGNRLESLVVSGTSGRTFFSASTTGVFYVDTLVVKSGGIVTHASNTTTALGVRHRLDISATTSITVESGGRIDTTGRGYQPTEGTGAGNDGGCGGGAGYGGSGGRGRISCSGTPLGGTPYGSVTQPNDVGSGGGSGFTGTGGGAGGGAAKLAAATVRIDGEVVSDGLFGTTGSAGGGSGGSVWIDATTLQGSGTVTAKGESAIDTGPGAGGGGRVAIYWTTDSSSWTVRAHGARAYNHTSNNAGQDGAAGTVYLKAASATNGDLIVDNNDFRNVALTTQVVTASQTYDNITIRKGANYRIPGGFTLTLAPGGDFTSGGSTQPKLTVDGTLNLGNATQTLDGIDVDHNGTIASVTNLTFKNGLLNHYTPGALWSANPGDRIGTLTLGSGGDMVLFNKDNFHVGTLTLQSGSQVFSATNAGSHLHSVNISATTSIQIDAGAEINVDENGHLHRQGPGTGTAGSTGGGAGHGGAGGRSTAFAAGGGIYDSITEPVEMGSGGGDSTGTSGINPRGGGVVKLSVASGGTLTVNGTVTAKGESDPGSGLDGGGGAGGAIWLDAPGATVTGAGTISVAGGSSDSIAGAGGGGGGRIAVYYSGSAPSFTYDARGGTGYGDGGAGTVYTKAAAQTYGDLLVDNEDSGRSGLTTQPASNTSITYRTVTFREGGHYHVPGGFTATVDAAADCSGIVGGGTIDGALTVDGTFVAPHASCTFTDLDLNHNGTIGTITALTMASGTYSAYTAGLLWSAGPGNRLTSLTLDSGGGYSASSTDALFVDVFTANSGSFVTHASNTTTASASNTLYISATSTITINSGALVTVAGSGYAASEGPGQGTDNATSAGGGGHGGSGGSSSVAAAGGGEYDDYAFPSDSGSGGGEDTGSSPVRAGPGGGALRFHVNDGGSMTIAARLTAEGISGISGDDSGGGAGGSIWLQASTMTISADLDADGGVGSTANGGCGGGGRIAVYSTTLDYSSGTATAATGCGGARAGTYGTVLFASFGEPPQPPVNGYTRILPSSPEVGQNVVISASATDDVGVSKIEIYLDGTNPGNLVKTCNFSPVQTPAECQYEAGSLSAGAHSSTVKSYDSVNQTDTDTTNFTVAGQTASNRLELSTYKKGATSTFSISFTLSATSTGTLTVTFPSEFTVNSAASSGSACLSGFGFTATTLTATKTGCAGTVTMTGASLTNPSAAGSYLVTFTNDNGEGLITIVEDDAFNISASVDPIMTFNVGSQPAATACDGTFTGDGGTLALGNLTTSAVASSDVASVPHICARLSTNAPGGAVVTVLSQNAALASIGSPGDTIPSSSATLAAGTSGYGLCVGSSVGDTGRDSTTPAGAAPVAAGPFGGSCTTSAHVVGGLTTSPQAVWSVSDPTQNAFVRLFVKAAIGTGVITHNDYADVLTFIATATF